MAEQHEKRYELYWECRECGLRQAVHSKKPITSPTCKRCGYQRPPRGVPELLDEQER